MKSLIHRSSALVGLLFSALVLAAPMWGATGNGVLTVDNAGCGGTGACSEKPQPEKWDVLPGETIHIHIEALGGACTSGPFPGKQCTDSSDCSISGGVCRGGGTNKKCSNATGVSCTSDADCNAVGVCTPGTLECSGDTHVIVKGHAGVCTTDAECDSTCGVNGNGPCECDTEKQACVKQWWIPATVSPDGRSIDVCWDVDMDMCYTATVAYCGDLGLLASENAPDGTGGRTQSGLRSVLECSVAGTCSTSGEVCYNGGGGCPHNGGTCNPADAHKATANEDCEREVPPCSNEPGSYCCGLTQGAYGAPNSIATAACSNSCAEGCGGGFIPAAACQGCDVFAGDPNATTAGIHGTQAVTLNNLATLQAYLPSSGTAGCFKDSGPGAVGADTHYDQANASTADDIPDLNPTQSSSRGQGGGVLSGQAMATRLNDYLSSCPTPFGGGSPSFTATGFGDFQIPGGLFCTKTSGPDKQLGNGDDVCAAFAYPSCTVGQTVDGVLAAANQHLVSCSNSLGCTATELVSALDNANRQFDNCGNTIACPDSVTVAGAFSCP